MSSDNKKKSTKIDPNADEVNPIKEKEELAKEIVDELEHLFKKYDIKRSVVAFDLQGSTISFYSPDIITGAKISKQIYDNLKRDIMLYIGEIS